jgi:hypothetical protein
LRNVIYADYVDTYKSRAVGSSGAGATNITPGGFLERLGHFQASVLPAVLFCRQEKDCSIAYIITLNTCGVCLCCAGPLISKSEMMVVLDADMVAEHDFFVR